jgi:hypothetical protein
MGTFQKSNAFQDIGEHWIEKFFHFLILVEMDQERTCPYVIGSGFATVLPFSSVSFILPGFHTRLMLKAVLNSRMKGRRLETLEQT